ncbi:MAG: radical SAM family RiPP maturation amino acid epimerase [Candidatus Vecturithrix sp.]|jgi:radical SAM family RiPP maturation amino acid epimerase|nr:radical SAM family RiPP maturation amino acid epimerase [Candidatus Vecturithrix sp.]
MENTYTQSDLSQDANNFHLTLLKHFSSDEMALLVQLKRFFEWMQGDPAFTKQVSSGDFSPAVIERLHRIGITFNFDELAILWKFPDIAQRFLLNCNARHEEDLPEEMAQTIAQYPLFALWGKYLQTRNRLFRKYMGEVAAKSFRIPANPRLDAWRLRRIAAVRSELGFFSYILDHPLLAFELSDGCSVGCWFCAFSTRKLTKNFDYLEHRDFFRQVAQICAELFGRNQASMALLYYGTEPHDNPHYLDFVKDYTEITGHPVCTSTAVPTDQAWMRELIAFYRQHHAPWPRLSVLSKAMLFKIHELYSPEELRDVELLMQLKQGPRRKVTAGRILKEQDGLRNREEGHYLDDIVPQGSIACVTGFLVNMVRGTVQLVSPCYTCQKWPYSYRIFDEATFSDAAGFRRAVETLIERNMPENPPKNMLVQFRDDLAYRPTEVGFDLASPNQVHHFRNASLHGPAGALIAEGTHTYAELYEIMTEQHKLNLIAVIMMVKKLFDDGFLNEVYTHPVQ